MWFEWWFVSCEVWGWKSWKREGNSCGMKRIVVWWYIENVGLWVFGRLVDDIEWKVLENGVMRSVIGIRKSWF